MLICYINMQLQGGYKLPSLFQVGGYKVFFWSNENDEPIHVHVGMGKPSENATKIWLTSSGGCIVANNGSRIPHNDLNELLEIISAQHIIICDELKNHFREDEVKFYC